METKAQHLATNVLANCPGNCNELRPPATGNVASASRVSADEARRLGDQFLRGYYPGTHVGNVDAFYGYYHFDVLRAGRQVAMLSVNSDTARSGTTRGTVNSSANARLSIPSHAFSIDAHG
jgi:hypothetical protein